MDFLQKLDFMMEKYSLNKRSLSKNSGIPYTTIDGWYKKGYEGMKMSTLKVLSDYFNTIVDYWATDEVTDPNEWKANGFVVSTEEMGQVQKYRLLDPYGKEAVDGVLDVESRRCEAEKQARVAAVREEREKIEAGDMLELETVCFSIPWFSHPMSAGAGEIAESERPDDLLLIKAPPKGTSYIAPVKGDSMEPTFYDGDKLFIHACVDLMPGQIGVFFMDGKQWVKELGDGVLISHNPNYDPIPMCEDIACQGIVLGVCDDSYFE